MTKLDDHPSVVRFRQSEPRPRPGRIDAETAAATLPGRRGRRRRLRRDRPPRPGRPAGRHPAASSRRTKTLLSFVCRMNREPIRSPARSVANLEFHHTGDHANEVARKVVAALESRGRPGGEPGDGLPDGDGPLPRQDLGRLAQAGRRRCGPGPHGHPPQRHPPQVRQLHPPGHGPDRRRGDRPTTSPSTTTRAWSASCAWRRARSGPSPRTATSTSRPATRTTTGSSWAASPIGSSRSPTARTPWTTARRVDDPEIGVDVAEPRVRGRTTRRRTAWRSARRGRT